MTVNDTSINSILNSSLHGIAYDWKNHYLLSGVNVAAVGGGQPPEGANAPIQFKNVTWDVTGHGTAEVWGHAIGSYQNFNANVHVTGASSVAFASNLDANKWTVLANTLAGSNNRPRISDASDLPFNPALRIVSNGKPSRGITRASIPCAVPTNVTDTPGSRRWISRATATPG